MNGTYLTKIVWIVSLDLLQRDTKNIYIASQNHSYVIKKMQLQNRFQHIAFFLTLPRNFSGVFLQTKIHYGTLCEEIY